MSQPKLSMNEHPNSNTEADEAYFREGLYQDNRNDAPPAHADALHADALGREITQRDTARIEAHSDAAYMAEQQATEETKPVLPSDALGAISDKAAAHVDELSALDLDTDTLYGSYQSIDSTYFNITNRHDSPVAGLAVLMDTTGQAIRSELHLYEDSTDAERQKAIRQANVLIKNQFSSHVSDPDSKLLELRIFDTRQKYATLYVDLPERAYASQRAGWNLQRLWPLAAAALLLLFGGLLVWWFLTNLSGGGGLTEDATQGDATTAVESADGENQNTLNLDPNKPILDLNSAQPQADQTQVVVGAPVNDSSEQAAQSGDDGSQAAAQSSAQAGASQSAAPQLEWINPSQVYENGLPSSVNANAAINRSSRVRVMQGLQIYLRSYPSPEAGTEKGVLTGGDEAIVVGGPYWTEGERDTIVWWYVRFDDDREGWVAANTSDLTLLEAVQ